jgi:hypothetical protein
MNASLEPAHPERCDWRVTLILLLILNPRSILVPSSGELLELFCRGA